MTNFRSLATAMLLGVSALTVAAPANAAAPCRDAHGRFTSCAGGAAAVAPKRTVAAQRSTAAPAHSALLSRNAPATANRTAAQTRVAAAARPAHPAAAAKPAVTTAHKTASAAHPSG